ncbi:MAG: ribonuclease H-like domain-containing protein [Gammaproteobacteria bacterium]
MRHAALRALNLARGNKSLAARSMGVSRGMMLRSLQKSGTAAPFKLLFLDIETAPNMSYTWGLHNQFISIDQIVAPGYTLCMSAKWEHNDEVMFRSIQEDGADGLAQFAHTLLGEADAVCTFNGKKFDVPVLTRDFLLHKMPPPRPYHHIDIYQVVRKQFRFASNKLDYLCQHLGLGGKVQHKGMQLWKDCMAGDADSWKTMREYNERDVTLLEGLYNLVLPYIPTHPNRGLWMDSTEPTCTHCGSTNVTEEGVVHLKVQTYPQWVCNDCGNYMRGRLRSAPPKEGVLL